MNTAPLSTLPLSTALIAIWELYPETDRPDNEPDPLVPILGQLWTDATDSERHRIARSLIDDDEQITRAAPGGQP